MDEWIDEEIRRVKEIDAEKTRQEERDKALSSQKASLWNDITYLAKEAIGKINASPEIVKKLGGSKLDYQELNIHSFQVAKPTYPAVYLTVTNAHVHVRLDRKLVTNGQSRNVTEQQEKLEIGLDSSGLIFLKTPEGGAMTVTDAVRYMLKPLLNY